jgi:hypothetical protein
MNQTKSDKEDQWHLDKKVPLSLIFAMLVQAAMVIWAIADIKKDVEVLKAAMVQQLDRDSRQDRATADAVGLVREDIKEVKVHDVPADLDRYDRYQQPVHRNEAAAQTRAPPGTAQVAEPALDRRRIRADRGRDDCAGRWRTTAFPARHWLSRWSIGLILAGAWGARFLAASED